MYFCHLISNVDKCSSQMSNFTPMQVTNLWGMWAISHPCCQSLWLWSLLKLLKVIAKCLHFCQLKWQTFILDNLIFLKWHKITKIVGGIKMKSAIPFQFQSIPSCNSNSNSGIGIGIAINANSNSRIYPNPDIYIYLRSKLYSIARISSDVVTKNYGRVWVLCLMTACVFPLWTAGCNSDIQVNRKQPQLTCWELKLKLTADRSRLKCC